MQVLKGVDLVVESGELVAIMGSSGSGKSTLLNILGLLDGYDEGMYRLGGKNMAKLTERRAAELRREMLGFVFQSFNLIGFKSAAENVALPLYYQKVPRKDRLRRSHELLERVGLLEWADHLPSQMRPSRAPSPRSPELSWLTNQQGRWTAPRPKKSWRC
jgi:putative ABC transport system ATP-binding protein